MYLLMLKQPRTFWIPFLALLNRLQTWHEASRTVKSVVEVLLVLTITSWP